MNWRNPFLITYLAVTVAGTAIFGYLLYSSFTRYTEVETSYYDAVSNLQRLQNKIPFPSAENNQKYVEYTKQYHAEYDKLLAKVGAMQRPLESISPQSFQDRLRSDVSQIEAAAKENNVTLPEGFYLGFDQYRGTLPNDAAAAPLARELSAIHLIADQLIQLKVREIVGIKRDLLPEEGGIAKAPASPKAGPGNRPQGNSAPSTPSVINANGFEVVFIADQSVTRAALNFIVNANQFFIIRYLTVQNSSLEGPKRVLDASATPPPDSAPASEGPSMRLIVGREMLTVALRIEMITFNNLPAQK